MSLIKPHRGNFFSKKNKSTCAFIRDTRVMALSKTLSYCHIYEMKQNFPYYTSFVERCQQEIERLKSKIHDLEAEEADLKRRLMGAERYKESLKDLKVKETKLGFVLDKLADKLEFYKDDLDQCKIDLIAAKQFTDDSSYKGKSINDVMIWCGAGRVHTGRKSVCTVGKIYTPIFSFFRKRVVNTAISEQRLISNEMSGNFTFNRGIH